MKHNLVHKGEDERMGDNTEMKDGGHELSLKQMYSLTLSSTCIIVLQSTDTEYTHHSVKQS